LENKRAEQALPGSGGGGAEEEGRGGPNNIDTYKYILKKNLIH
jgi:hypothetical protein